MSHMFTPVNQNARSQRHLLREFSDFYYFNCDLIIQLRDPIFFSFKNLLIYKIQLSNYIYLLWKYFQFAFRNFNQSRLSMGREENHYNEYLTPQGLIIIKPILCTYGRHVFTYNI